MNERDQTEFAKLMVGLAEYYAKPLTEVVLGIYWQALRHHDLAAVRDAIHRHIRNPDNGQWMPKVADIERLASGSTESKALVAWTKVDRAMSHVGPWRDVVFDDPIIHRVLFDMGGWIMLGEKAEKDWPFLAREFAVRYRGYATREIPPDYAPILGGMANRGNSASGHPQEPPILFGPQAQCQVVMAGGTDQQLIGTDLKPHLPRIAMEAPRMAA